MNSLYNGTIAVVDLAAGSVEEEDLADELVEEHFGGPALNLALYEQYRDDDPLILGAGPLTGSMAPGGAVMTVTGKSPVTGKVGHVPVSMFIGMEMKLSGFDFIVLRGQSDAPVYLWMRDGIADLSDAAGLWGQDTWAALDEIRHSIGDPMVQTILIGTLGEEGCDGAAFSQNYWPSADTLGFGKVLGGKKVKAVAARGLGIVDVEDPEAYQKAVFKVLAEIKASGPRKSLEDADKNLGSHFHRHSASFSSPVPDLRYYRLEAGKDLPAKEQGILVSNPGWIEALKSLGLSEGDALAVLKDCACAGASPAAVAEQAKSKGSSSAADVKALIDGGDISGKADESIASADDCAAYILGVLPQAVAEVAPVTLERLIDLFNVGTGLEKSVDDLRAAAEKVMSFDG